MEIFAMQGIWGKRSISKKNATNFTLSLAFSFPAPRQLSGNFMIPCTFPFFFFCVSPVYPLLEQPLSLFRLVKCLDLGQQEPGEALQLLLGHAVPGYLADAAACAVVFSCRSSVAAPFCRAAPCCLAACSFIDPDPWPAGGVADGSAVFPPVGGGRCPTQMPALAPAPPARLPGKDGSR